MKYLKICLSIIFSLLFLNVAKAQKKKIYFYVDTLTVDQKNRVVEITGKGEIIYTFFCKCLETKQDISFAYLTGKSDKLFRKKPNESYISWKDLLNLIDNNMIQFNEKYELFITEVLPSNKYKTNKVFSIWKREPTILNHKIN